MARPSHKPEPADTLEQLRTLSDRVAEAIAGNPGTILTVLGVVLAIAAGYGGWIAWMSSREDAASAELAATRRAFESAMGREPGALEAVEPANPEIAIRTRAEFAERFEAVAEAHSGTAAAPVAWLEAGDLRAESGKHEAALEAWQAGLEKADDDSPLRALLHQRIGATEEAQGRWLEAAQAYEAAGSVTSYPPRYLMLAEAARCYAAAGEPARAIALHDRIRNEAPGLSLPPHVRSLLAELRVAATLSEVEPATP